MIWKIDSVACVVITTVLSDSRLHLISDLFIVSWSCVFTTKSSVHANSKVSNAICVVWCVPHVLPQMLQPLLMCIDGSTYARCLFDIWRLPSFANVIYAHDAKENP